MTFGRVVGSPGVFDKGMDVGVFESKLTNFFLANSIECDAKRRAVLLCSVSEEVYAVIFSLCFPGSPDATEYGLLMKSMRNYFGPITEPCFAARHRFYRAKQRRCESVHRWGARVKNLASKCSFSSESTTVIRDVFVVGTTPGPVRDRLLEEDASNVEVTFSFLMDIATIAEATMNYKSGLKKETAGLMYRKKWNKPGLKEKRTSREAPKKFNGKCGICDRSNHARKDCRYKNYNRNSCDTKYHSSNTHKVGKKENKDNNKINTFVANNNFGSNTVNYRFADTLFSMIDRNSQSSKIKPYTVELIVENNNVKFEIDTGSQHSVISKKLYRQLFSYIKIHKNDVSLSDYVGNNIKPIGKIVVNSEYQNNKFSMCIYVINNGGPPLIGRNDMHNVKSDSGFNIENNETLEDIIGMYNGLFKNEIGTFNRYEISLNIKPGAVPKFYKSRSIPLALKGKVETEIDRLVENNILVPVDHSRWATPIVPIFKPDGTVRICGDYKLTINPVLEGTKCPPSKIEHLYADIKGSKYFSTINLKDAYRQMVVKESDRKYTTISTHKGLFVYTRNPFGIKFSAEEFQKIMKTSTAGIEGVGLFHDDIIVAGSSISEHNSRLHKLLNVLLDSGIRIKCKKCTFLQQSVEYLARRIDENGLHALTKHTDAIENIAVPENKKILKSFLCLVSYYAKFIPTSADILKPLNILLRNGIKWEWSPDCDSAFRKIKQILISKPVLAHYDHKLPIKLVVNSSSLALGAILSHIYSDRTERPVAYASKSLSEAECKFSQIEKEGLAIMFGIKHFHDYLYGRKFLLETDHKPLLYIFGDKKGIPIYATNRLQRWAYKLSSFDFEIKYVTSENNAAAFLSLVQTPNSAIKLKTGENVGLSFIHEQSPFKLDWSKIKTEINKDPLLAKVSRAVKTGDWNGGFSNNLELKSYFLRKTQISVEQGCLLWGYRVIIPVKFRNSLLKQLHYSHMSSSSMKSLAMSYFWWPGMEKEIENITDHCDKCLDVRKNVTKSVEPPWKRPEMKPWTRVHCDFLGPFQKEYFFVMVDATTKRLEVFPVNSMTTDIVTNKISETIARFGVPKTITSDGAECFTGLEFQSYCKSLGIRHVTGSPPCPESNDFAESAVKAIRQFYEKNITAQSPMNKFLSTYRRTSYPAARKMSSESIVSKFDPRVPNSGKTTVERQITQVNIRYNRTNSYNVGDTILAKNNRNNDDKWQKGKTINCVSKTVYGVKSNDGTVRKKHSSHLLTDKSAIPLSRDLSSSSSPLPTSDVNVNSESVETFSDKSSNSVAVDRPPKLIRRRKHSQRSSQSCFD